MSTRYAEQAHVQPVVDRTLFDGRLRPGAGDREDAYLASPTVQSHAAMLERLGNGDLGLVWFGGTQEGVGDISIWFSRLPVESDRWSEPVQVSDDPTRSEQNPVLFVTPTGELWLLWTAQLAGNQDTAEVRRRISLDEGATWGPTETLFPASEKGGVFIRQPVVVTASGRWLIGTFSCVRVEGQKWSGDFDTAAVRVSDDQGATWREIEVPDSVGAVHMNIVELPDGTLSALYRSRFADFILRSVSTDGGDTWSTPVPTELPNNNSSVQQRLLSDGRVAVVYNHASQVDATGRRENLYDEIDDDGLVEKDPAAEPAEPAAPTAESAAEPEHRRSFWGSPRAPLSLAFSADGGESFTVAGNLDEGDGYALTNNSRDGLNREFSYPAISEAPDGSLDVAYTYFRQTIKHVRIPADWHQDR